MTKRQRRLLQLVLTTLVLSVLMPAWAGAAQKGLKLNKSRVELYAGAEGSNTFRLKVKNKAVLGDEEVTFKSSRPGIAQVDEKGLITALKKGNATIIVKAGGKKATCKVTVKRPTLTLLTPGKIYLSPGGTQKISVSTVPSSGKKTYVSSNPEVASVNKWGRVKGKAAGEAVITVRANGRKKKVQVTVGNKKPSVETLKWNPSWRFAGNSKIHTSTVKLYRAANSNGHVVCVNAGHGTSGGESVYTLCHPDGSLKVTGGSTEAGAKYATSVSSGTVFLDGTSEADANLSLAKLLKTALLEAGFDVLMIRESTNVQLDNIARTLFANCYAECHIALHYDSTTNDKGAYFIGVPDIASYRAMQPVASNWRGCNRLGENVISGMRESGVKIYGSGNSPGDLTQTSYSTVPSIDIEVGDRGSSHSAATQSRIAKGIVRGVQKFFKTK